VALQLCDHLGDDSVSKRPNPGAHEACINSAARKTACGSNFFGAAWQRQPQPMAKTQTSSHASKILLDPSAISGTGSHRDVDIFLFQVVDMQICCRVVVASAGFVCCPNFSPLLLPSVWLTLIYEECQENKTILLPQYRLCCMQSSAKTISQSSKIDSLLAEPEASQISGQLEAD